MFTCKWLDHILVCFYLKDDNELRDGESSPKMSHEMADKLDVMMDIVLAYIRSVCSPTGKFTYPTIRYSDCCPTGKCTHPPQYIYSVCYFTHHTPSTIYCVILHVNVHTLHHTFLLFVIL